MDYGCIARTEDIYYDDIVGIAIVDLRKRREASNIGKYVLVESMVKHIHACRALFKTQVEMQPRLY